MPFYFGYGHLYRHLQGRRIGRMKWGHLSCPGNASFISLSLLLLLTVVQQKVQTSMAVYYKSELFPCIIRICHTCQTCQNRQSYQA